MKDFAYHRPESLDEALRLLREGDGEVRPLAGGQSLIPIMKLDMAEPDGLVSLADLPELKGIDEEGDTVVVGAGSTHAEIAASELVRRRIPGLARMAEGIGDPQVRNLGTLGGSLAHADPAADYPAAVVALGATVVTDRREIPGEDFFVAMFTTALESDEIVVSVRFPVPRCSAYAKFRNPASRYALAGTMVARTDEGVRVAVTGAGPYVFRATELEERLDEDFSPGALEGARVPADDLLDDADASAEYRAQLAWAMAKRAAEACR